MDEYNKLLHTAITSSDFYQADDSQASTYMLTYHIAGCFCCGNFHKKLNKAPRVKFKFCGK